MKKKKQKEPIITISIDKTEVQAKAYSELFDFIEELSEKYNLTYFDIHGILGVLEHDLNKRMDESN